MYTLIPTVYRALLNSAVSGTDHRIHTTKKTLLLQTDDVMQGLWALLHVIGHVPLIDWISDTLSQGYTNLQSLVQSLIGRVGWPKHVKPTSSSAS